MRCFCFYRMGGRARGRVRIWGAPSMRCFCSYRMGGKARSQHLGASMKRVLVSWSSGKDCAWALHLLRQQPDIEIVGLLTTINAEFDRVAMHGTRGRSWKRRPTPRIFRSGKSRFPGPVPTRSTSNAWPMSACAPSADEASMPSHSEIFSFAMCATYREKQLKSTGSNRSFRSGKFPPPNSPAP